MVRKGKLLMGFRYFELKVLEWADEKGIFEKGNPIKQMDKTIEEVEELRKAIHENDMPEIIDGIGDVLVTLIIQAEMQGLDPLQCLETAYNVIKDRTGEMIDGTFVKSEDL